MTDQELKKIRENISCPELGDEHYGRWGALPRHQRIAIYNLLQKIERQKEHIADLETITGLMHKRKYYRKFVDEVYQKQEGKELSSPDFDYIYQIYFEQKAEIERLQARSADVVEVVRCKDCAFYFEFGPEYTYKGTPAKYCAWHNILMGANDFCSSGTKKEV